MLYFLRGYCFTYFCQTNHSQEYTFRHSLLARRATTIILPITNYCSITTIHYIDDNLNINGVVI